jgi:hypothetical protein
MSAKSSPPVQPNQDADLGVKPQPGEGPADQNELTGQAEDAGKLAPKAERWSPPPVDKKTGLTMHGDYPLSGPARAQALVDAGLAEDPDGILTAEQIAGFAPSK